MTTTYVDSVGAARAWINSRTTTLVGVGKPLQKGAYLRDHEGAADVCYAVLTALPGTTSGGGAESPQMYARISASVYGPTIEAITYAAIGLADEISTYLAGQWTNVTTSAGPVQIWAGDDISGPSDLPDGNLPRQIVDFTLIMQPDPDYSMVGSSTPSQYATLAEQVDEVADDVAALSVDARWGRTIPTPVAAVLRRLRTGYWPVATLLLGDSTGNATDEWYYQTMLWLAGKFPTRRTRYQLWNDTTQAYNAASIINPGTGSVRRITVPANSGINLQAPNSTALQITGDMSVRAAVTFNTMPPGTSVDVCGKTGGAGNRAWWMTLSATGFLQLSWSTDGTATTSQTSSAAVGAGVTGLRADLDVDNGATQHTVIFYTSTDWNGTTGTWNQLGSIRTGAGVTVVFGGTSTTQLISRSNGTWPVPGTATGLQVTSAGVTVIDMDMGTLTDQGTTLTDYLGNVWTLIGAPARTGDMILAVYNGSVTSTTVAYATDGTRFPKLTPYPADLAFINYSHNEGSGLTYPGFTTLTTALIAKWPTVAVVPALQNPKTFPGQAQNLVDAHAMRTDLIATIAAQNRWNTIDAYAAIMYDGRPLSQLIDDGTHPTADGMALWTATAKALFTPWL